MNPMNWDDVRDNLSVLCPGVEVRIVEESGWFIRTLFKINGAGGMTIGKKIYLLKSQSRDVATLHHEGRHARDYDRWRWFFLWTYIGPAWLSIMPLVALMWLLSPDLRSLWWTMAAVGIAFAQQAVRAFWEFRGYEMDMAVEYLQTGRVSDGNIRWMVGVFSGPMYWFMLPIPPLVQWILERKRDKLYNLGQVGTAHMLTR